MTARFTIDRNRLAQLWQALDKNPNATIKDYLRVLPRAVLPSKDAHSALCQTLSQAGAHTAQYWQRFFADQTGKIIYRTLQDMCDDLCQVLALNAEEKQTLHTQMQRSFWHARPETLQQLLQQCPNDETLHNQLKHIISSTLLNAALDDVKHRLYRHLGMPRPPCPIFYKTQVLPQGIVAAMATIYHLNTEDPLAKQLVRSLQAAEEAYHTKRAEILIRNAPRVAGDVKRNPAARTAAPPHDAPPPGTTPVVAETVTQATCETFASIG